MDPITQMLARVRRHMITSFGGIALAFTLLMGGGAIGRVLFGPAIPGWWGVLSFAAILLIPAIGFYSTFTNLRCPSCNRMVALQVSTNASLFGRSASKTCRHCGVQIFDDRLFLRFRRTGLIVFFGTLCLGFGSAILSAVLGGHH
jgi:hypothetical protein